MATDTRLAFVFGGGGSRGACQVGMLRELLQLGMVPDLLLGVSVGALNAAVFGEQPNLDGVRKLSELWLGAPLQSLFPRRRTLRYLSDRESVHPSFPLRKLITDNLSMQDLADTKIPLHVLLADTHTGEESWFDEGPIVDILYGSAAIPGVLPPLRLRGRRFIDGGMINPNPVRHAVELGASRIVLLLCGSLTPSFHSKSRPLTTLLMGYTLTQLSLTKMELANLPESVSIVVLECGAADSIDALDFRHSNLLVTAGQRSVDRAKEQLNQLL
ncbi:patatin-like phospholipase family protein [Ferrimicrobium acidiphilum]|uniref:patatin-like phospholipase family protein n=1 Tax=Ferrimicrobium acidiphilum TaxID=121039 RepID=UPI0023F07866|nr:patatin-like phospholipase family protein [Ferrimicrobium acidiphilum]